MSNKSLIRYLLAAVAMVALAGCMEMAMMNPPGKYGEITTFDSKISDKIYPAYVVEIDDENVNTSLGPSLQQQAGTVRHVFRLEPGRHTIRVVADFTNPVRDEPVRALYTPRSEQPGEIEVYVEEGRKYYLGAKLVGQRSDEWEPVVWRVEDLENYEHTIVE